LGDAYVKGHFDVNGSLTDVIHMGYALATPKRDSVLTSVKRGPFHSKQSDKQAIQYH
jgi:cyclopropane-fatty-acyl-phospholipid synthase